MSAVHYPQLPPGGALAQHTATHNAHPPQYMAHNAHPPPPRYMARNHNLDLRIQVDFE